MATTNLGKVGITPRLIWSNTVSDYEYLDTVAYDGSSYMVVIKTGKVPAGILPTNTNYYQRVATKGDDGWIPVLALEAYGAKRIKKLTGYFGGTGTAPNTDVGKYVGVGGFVVNKDDAQDFIGPQGIAGAIASPYTEFVDFTANKTLAATDENKMLRGNSMAPLVLTIPSNDVSALPVGFKTMIKQQGVGVIFVTHTIGVTLEAPGGRITSETQYSQFWLIKEGLNKWSVEGSLVNYAINLLKSYVDTDGGIIDMDLAISLYTSAIYTFTNDTTVLLIPAAYKASKIYGLNPVNGEVKPLAFSRAGTATYVDKNGVMQIAPVNTPRVNYSQMTKHLRGYMVEPAATNMLPFSNNFNSWAKTGNAVSVTENYATRLGMSFSKVEVLVVTTTQQISQLVPLSVDQEVRCTTIYANSGNISSFIIYSFSTGGSGNTGALVVDMVAKTVTGSGTNTGAIEEIPGLGFKITVFQTATAVAGTAASVSIRLPANSPIGSFIELSTGDCVLNNPGSHIPTNGSQVTRPADVATLAIPVTGSLYMDKDGVKTVQTVNAGTFTLPYGHIKGLSLFNRVLTASEITQITA